MKDKPLDIINYQPRTERLTVREAWAKAPVHFSLLLCAICNIAVCAYVYHVVGGDSIGIMPSSQGYVVRDHGRFTPVTKRIWFFSLFYPAATLSVTPLAVVLVITSLIRGLFSGRPPFVRATLLISPVYVPWAYAIIRDMCLSAMDAWQLNSAWPAMAWLLRGATVLIISTLIIWDLWMSRGSRPSDGAGQREDKKTGRLELDRKPGRR